MNIIKNECKREVLDDLKSEIKKKYDLEITNKHSIKKEFFKLGDVVLMTNGPQSNPLKYGWERDFVVTEVLNYDSYKIKKGNRTLIRNAKHLKFQNKILVGRCCTSI
ncbi:hypothetical protein COBT_001710 [Conglomerata obtusa]